MLAQGNRRHPVSENWPRWQVRVQLVAKHLKMPCCFPSAAVGTVNSYRC